MKPEHQEILILDYIAAATARRAEEDRLLKAGRWEELDAHRATPRPEHPPAPTALEQLCSGWQAQHEISCCAWSLRRESGELAISWTVQTHDGLTWVALVVCHGPGARVMGKAERGAPAAALEAALAEARRRASALGAALAPSAEGLERERLEEVCAQAADVLRDALEEGWDIPWAAKKALAVLAAAKPRTP